MKIRASVFVCCVALAAAGCTDPGETTGIGAATGGAVGAGLGAIIGSQTGSAGPGLVIGAAAGAATGGLIANSIEAQEQADRTQDEAIERQEEMIAAHGRQLEEMKHARDGGNVVPSAVSGAAMGYSYPGSTLRLSAAERARLARGEPLDPAVTRGSFRSETFAGAIAPRAVVQRQARSFEPAIRSAPQPRIAQPAAKALRSAPSSSSGLTERDIAVPAHPAEPKHQAAVSTDRVSGSSAAETIPPLPEDTDTAAVMKQELGSGTEHKEVEAPKEEPFDISKPAPAKVAQPVSVEAPKSEECQKASDEVNKAAGSQDVADKLFHFRRALRLCPNEPSYHVGLGGVYQSLNRTSDAEFEYREALRLNPSMAEARESLDKLRY